MSKDGVTICGNCNGEVEEESKYKNVCIKCSAKYEHMFHEPTGNDEFSQCSDCVHKDKVSPCPCDSCVQVAPTNYAEEE